MPAFVCATEMATYSERSFAFSSIRNSDECMVETNGSVSGACNGPAHLGTRQIHLMIRSVTIRTIKAVGRAQADHTGSIGRCTR